MRPRYARQIWRWRREWRSWHSRPPARPNIDYRTPATGRRYRGFIDWEES